MTQENKGKKFLIGLAILLLIGASGVYLYYAEGEAPSISIQPEQGFRIHVPRPFLRLVYVKLSSLTTANPAICVGISSSSWSA